MRSADYIFDRRSLLSIALTALLLLAATSTAFAQSAKNQYGERQTPSGPVAGLSCVTLESEDDLLNAGDFVSFGSGFSVAPGASIIIEDADGTQGLLVDGDNADISEGDGGSIDVVVTGAPTAIVGGDGAMSSAVCNSVVTTTGISLDEGEATEDEGTILGVLPDTGGPSLIGMLGALAVLGTGFAIFRRTRRRS